LEHKVKKTAKYQKSKLEIQGDGVKTKSLTASDMENNLPKLVTASDGLVKASKCQE
jgi:hypothetical protein